MFCPTSPPSSTFVVCTAQRELTACCRLIRVLIFQIREEIEEIVTTYTGPDHAEDEDDKSQQDQSSRKVSFPELGMELIEGDGRVGGEDPDCPPYVVTVPDSSWQHNWLFRKQLQADKTSGLTATAFPPVSMLVPNPVLETKTQIGNRDFDLVSELSERTSVASFDVSSISYSGSDLDEDMQVEQVEVEEGRLEEQEDQEYTIYSLLPPTRRPLSSSLTWLAVPQNLTVHEGKIVTLQCSVAGEKPIDVAWFKQSEPIPKSAKYWIHRRKDCHLLTIFDVMAEDCGSYSCVAFNKSSELWHSIELTVKGRREN